MLSHTMSHARPAIITKENGIGMRLMCRTVSGSEVKNDYHDRKEVSREDAEASGRAVENGA